MAWPLPAAFFMAREVRLEIADHAGHGGEPKLQRGKRVEGRLLVLLHVLGVGERQPLHHHEQRDKGAGDAPGLGAHELGRVGVALLRHDR